jgi:hypothetical protein
MTPPFNFIISADARLNSLPKSIFYSLPKEVSYFKYSSNLKF